MNVENTVKVVKEKGPAFVFGVLLGVAVITAFVNRDRIVNVVENALGRRKAERGEA